jgi:hypothetical protein
MVSISQWGMFLVDFESYGKLMGCGGVRIYLANQGHP